MHFFHFSQLSLQLRVRYISLSSSLQKYVTTWLFACATSALLLHFSHTWHQVCAYQCPVMKEDTAGNFVFSSFNFQWHKTVQSFNPLFIGHSNRKILEYPLIDHVQNTKSQILAHSFKALIFQEHIYWLLLTQSFFEQKLPHSNIFLPCNSRFFRSMVLHIPVNSEDFFNAYAMQ